MTSHFGSTAKTIAGDVCGAKTRCAPEKSMICRQDANFGIPQYGVEEEIGPDRLVAVDFFGMQPRPRLAAGATRAELHRVEEETDLPGVMLVVLKAFASVPTWTSIASSAGALLADLHEAMEERGPRVGWPDVRDLPTSASSAPAAGAVGVELQGVGENSSPRCWWVGRDNRHVVHGPAREPVPSYTVRLENGALRIEA